MFFSGLAGFNYTVNPCWDEARSLTTWRSYNYPHVTIVYWSLYRVARNYGNASVLKKGWQWYLGQAVNTTLLGVAKHGQYNNEGLMAGSVWRLLLHDLKREGSDSNSNADADAIKTWLAAAAQIETFMRGRAEDWAKMPFPFGSEMPWDRCALRFGRADADAVCILLSFHTGGHQDPRFHSLFVVLVNAVILARDRRKFLGGLVSLGCTIRATRLWMLYLHTHHDCLLGLTTEILAVILISSYMVVQTPTQARKGSSIIMAHH
jgi:hypothetical protein